MVNVPSGSRQTFLIMCKNVELLVSPSSPGTATSDKLGALRELDFNKDHPETRTDIGEERDYTYGSPDMEMTFKITATYDSLEYLRVRNTLNSFGVLPIYTWAFKGTANDGTTKTITMKGTLPKKRIRKYDIPHQRHVDIECMIRITDEAEPVAT